MRALEACTIVLCPFLALPTSAQSSPERPWTLLVYGAADNNADGPILEFLDGVRKALDDDPGMELVLFIDRHARYSDDATLLGEDFAGARIYRLRRDSAERLAANEFFPGMDDGDLELDSADPDVLRRFVAFGKARFPAQRTGLLVYSHADGRTMCPDETSGTEMEIPKLADVVPAEQSVDFLALELCNMGGIEVAYEWRPSTAARFSADVLVAIPNAGPPLDWDRAFARIRSAGHATEAHASAVGGPTFDPRTLTPEEFGKLVVEEGERGRRAFVAAHPEHAEDARYEAAACFDLRRAEEVKTAVDALAAALARSDSKRAFLALREPGPDGHALNYMRGGFLVDLHDLCARAARCEELAEDARKAALDACMAVDRFVIASFGMDGYPGFEPGVNGVAIVLPVGDERDGNGVRWKRFTWYTPLAAQGSGAPYGRWGFLDGGTADDGRVETWFELLDSWFDDPADPSGGPNGYHW